MYIIEIRTKLKKTISVWPYLGEGSPAVFRAAQNNYQPNNPSRLPVGWILPKYRLLCKARHNIPSD
jgi:hypothetical protein